MSSNSNSSINVFATGLISSSISTAISSIFNAPIMRVKYLIQNQASSTQLTKETRYKGKSEIILSFHLELKHFEMMIE